MAKIERNKLIEKKKKLIEEKQIYRKERKKLIEKKEIDRNERNKFVENGGISWWCFFPEMCKRHR